MSESAISIPSDDFWYCDMSEWHPSPSLQEKMLDKVADVIRDRDDREFVICVELSSVYSIPSEMSYERYLNR